MSVRRGIGIMFGGNVSTFIITFAASITIARLLSPSELGIYAAAMALVSIINAVLNVGFSSYIVREREMPPEKLGSVLLLTLAQAVMIAGLLYLGAPLIGDFAHDQRVTTSVRILAWYGGLTSLLLTVFGIMQREMRFDRVVACTVVNVGLAAIVTIALAATGWSWRSMPIGGGVGVSVALVIALCMQRADLAAARLGFSHVRPILAFGAKIIPPSIILNVTNRMPDIILTRAMGASANGLYNRGANLIDTFNNTVMQSVQRVMQSQLARDRDTDAGIGPVYGVMNRMVTGLFWPLFALLGVLSAPLISLLFGAQWVAAAPVLAIVALAGAISLIVACRGVVLITVGKEGTMARLEMVRGVIGVATFTVAAYTGGIVWAAATRILDAVASVLLYSPGIHAATQLSWATTARGFVRSGLIAAITAVPATVVMTIEGWPQHLPVLELIGVGLLSGATWLAAVFALRHELAHEITRAACVARGLLPRIA